MTGPVALGSLHALLGVLREIVASLGGREAVILSAVFDRILGIAHRIEVVGLHARGASAAVLVFDFRGSDGGGRGLGLGSRRRRFFVGAGGEDEKR